MILLNTVYALRHCELWGLRLSKV